MTPSSLYEHLCSVKVRKRWSTKYLHVRNLKISMIRVVFTYILAIARLPSLSRHWSSIRQSVMFSQRTSVTGLEEISLHWSLQWHSRWLAWACVVMAIIVTTNRTNTAIVDESQWHGFLLVGCVICGASGVKTWERKLGRMDRRERVKTHKIVKT